MQRPINILQDACRACLVPLGILLLAVVCSPTTSYAQDEEMYIDEVIEYPTFKIGGFTDYNYLYNLDGQSKGFKDGQFTLHFASALASKVSFFGEMTFTPKSDHTFKPVVERAIAKFSYSDYLKLAVGRFHTPINYWNTTFHHGFWLQTTVGRPRMLGFGGTFIPVHLVGAMLEGMVPARGLNLNYYTALGNGRQESSNAQPGDAGDDNGNRAFIVGLFFKPDMLYGLRVGGAVFLDSHEEDIGNIDETLASAHIVWDSESPEVIFEFANIHRASVVTENFWAYYLQLGYRVNRLKPYFRFEKTKVAASETGFQFGMRFDIIDLAALKTEFAVQKIGNASYKKSLVGQVSVVF